MFVINCVELAVFVKRVLSDLCRNVIFCCRNCGWNIHAVSNVYFSIKYVYQSDRANACVTIFAGRE